MMKDIKQKSSIRKLIRTVMRNILSWILPHALYSLLVIFIGKKLHKNSQNTLDDFQNNAISTICPDLVVRHGPFKGMKYSGRESFSSALFPKLLGSYEREIQPIIEEICKQEYTEVVDIGCAEGYYAIGFAMRMPKATIYAYDTDQAAACACQKMARLNNVDQRVITGSFCSNETLQKIPFRGKGLIISDCEGYEISLFSERIVPTLARHDLLIELHDFIDINISSIIRKQFERTHEIIAIESIDDIKKAQTYSFEELQNCSLQERKQLLSEWRPSIMQWFYMKSFQKQ